MGVTSQWNDHTNDKAVISKSWPDRKYLKYTLTWNICVRKKSYEDTLTISIPSKENKRLTYWREMGDKPVRSVSMG